MHIRHRRVRNGVAATESLAVPGVAFTIAHKTLHHKRPELFPLLDNVTEQVPPTALPGR